MTGNGIGIIETIGIEVKEGNFRRNGLETDTENGEKIRRFLIVTYHMSLVIYEQISHNAII
jgi:hypothetical protein